MEDHFTIVKSKGKNILPRKDHHSAIFAKSMIVFGGQYENGLFANEMLNFDLDLNDWTRVHYK